MNQKPHIPVLYREILEAFADIKSGTIVDCTLGYAGHSSMLLESNSNISIIGIDQDKEAIEYSSKALECFKDRVKIIKGRYSSVIKTILSSDIKGVLADIGVSSLQLDKKERGFSFLAETLDMRMDQDSTFSALNVLNEYPLLKLEQILRDYGEIKNYQKIASLIVQNRPFYDTKKLLDILKPHLFASKSIHPATLLFQAIRIEVNDELGELERLLDALESSKISTKVAIISFHSLEDRVVKNRFAYWAKSCRCDDNALRCTCGNNNSIGRVLTKKPIVAKNDELKLNPRSRSAKLRIFEFI